MIGDGVRYQPLLINGPLTYFTTKSNKKLALHRGLAVGEDHDRCAALLLRHLAVAKEGRAQMKENID